MIKSTRKVLTFIGVAGVLLVGSQTQAMLPALSRIATQKSFPCLQIFARRTISSETFHHLTQNASGLAMLVDGAKEDAATATQLTSYALENFDWLVTTHYGGPFLTNFAQKDPVFAKKLCSITLKEIDAVRATKNGTTFIKELAEQDKTVADALAFGGPHHTDKTSALPGISQGEEKKKGSIFTSWEALVGEGLVLIALVKNAKQQKEAPLKKK